MIVLALAGAFADGWLDTLPNGRGGTLPPGLLLTPAAIIIAILAARELAALLRQADILASTFLTCTIAVLGLLVSAFLPDSFSGVTGGAVVSLAVASVLVCSMMYYGRHKTTDGMIAAAGGSLLAFCLLGLLLGYIVTLRREYDIWIVLWVLLTTKSSENGVFTLTNLLERH